MRSNRTLRYFSSLIKAFPDLTGKEKRVVVKRLRKRTHSSIGKKWNLTEGRIRQIEKRAIEKMKSRYRQLTLFKSDRKR